MEKSLQEKLQEELNNSGVEHTLFRYNKMLETLRDTNYNLKKDLSDIELVLENIISEIKRLDALKDLKDYHLIEIGIHKNKYYRQHSGKQKNYIKFKNEIIFKSEIDSNYLFGVDSNLIESLKLIIKDLIMNDNLNQNYPKSFENKIKL